MDIQNMSHEKVHTLLKKDLVESLQTEMQTKIVEIENIIRLCENNSLINEQWFLDFLDKINEISTKY